MNRKSTAYRIGQHIQNLIIVAVLGVAGWGVIISVLSGIGMVTK